MVVFVGSKFWRFDPTQRPPVKSTYPKPISNWEGVPDNLDAAFQYTNGYTYFYKDDGYYRFNDRQFAVDSANPAFPRSSASWWFGCKSAPRGTIGTRTYRGWLLDGGSDYNYGLQSSDSFEDDPIEAGRSSIIGPWILLSHFLTKICKDNRSLLLNTLLYLIFTKSY